jgi:hypothetical protein
MEDYHSGRSDRWQESDAGTQFQVWIDAWSNEISEPDYLERPGDMEAPDDASQDFMDLPNSPEEA